MKKIDFYKSGQSVLYLASTMLKRKTRER